MHVAEFLRWWTGQLRELLPAALRRKLRGEHATLVIELDRQGASVTADQQDRRHDFGKLDTTAPDSDRRDELQAFVSGLPTPPDRVVVRLRPGRYLRRQVELPLAAEENLTEAIGFQMDSLTPFTADQVLYFCGVSKRIPGDRKLLAWLVATPTLPVEQVLEMLGDIAPMPMQFPRHSPAADEPLELAFKTAHGRRSSRVGVPALALVVLFCAIGGVAALHVHNRMESRDHLQSAMLEARTRAVQADDLRTVVDAVGAQARDLADRRAARVLHVALLEDITRRLGDDTWLQRLDVREGKVSLQGVSGSASNLISLLEASPYLEAVRFESSITRDRRYDGDRFSISAQLSSAGEKG